MLHHFLVFLIKLERSNKQIYKYHLRLTLYRRSTFHDSFYVDLHHSIDNVQAPQDGTRDECCGCVPPIRKQQTLAFCLLIECTQPQHSSRVPSLGLDNVAYYRSSYMISQVVKESKQEVMWLEKTIQTKERYWKLLVRENTGQGTVRATCMLW